MIPFGDLYFFYILLILLIPAVIIGLMGKSLKIYGMIVNFIMLVFILQTSKKQAILLLLFFSGELFLVLLYLRIRHIYSQRWILWIFIFSSLIPLMLVKWGNIFIHRSLGFIGVSYLTFKIVQVLIETYDGLIDHINIFDFTYFLLFFPAISSGPIDRSRRFSQNINSALSGSEYVIYLRNGIWKLFTGLAYKFIFATLINNYWMSKIPHVHDFLTTVNYMYAYSLYLFFDFAGYSLIAIGTSYILGIKTPDNFNLPFISKDIKDFWNRWHMSLSFWFRDFIYTRFVMSSLKHKWFKSRYTASYIGFIITMLTMGIWHGNEIYYIIYGLYHGVLIVVTDIYERKSRFYKKHKNSEIYNIFSIIITIHLVCFGFLIFSGRLFIK